VTDYTGVSVTEKTVVKDKQKNIEAADVAGILAPLCANRNEADIESITKAWVLANSAHLSQVRVSGEPFVEHVLAVATILAKLRLDTDTIVAALLHDVVEDTAVESTDLKRDFGESVARLVEGVTKMSHIRVIRDESEKKRKEHVRAESLRKMLLAMAEDVRVVLIKLADRLHNMRTLSSLPEEKQQRIARETMDIFAPLANRLGIWQIKWELEDLSFRYIEPDAYHEIASMLAERRIDREQYLEKFVDQVKNELANAGIKADVYGRPKHIFGIWKKMRNKRKGFHEIYDVRAVRIVTREIKDCYGALGIVHTLWQYIPGEFDDYIATPKENNYRSIHTAVIGEKGKTVEIQVRTKEMHQQSEYGVAAHWRYKEGAEEDASFDEKINWLRQLLEWKDEVSEASEFVDQFKSEVFSDRVYVFTPMGNIIDLPQGATPIDFAYEIHSEVGHRCRGAKVDGRIVPLTYVLKTGSRVEVLTVKKGGPSRDWLNPHLGYIHTTRARTKAQYWFRQQDRENNIASGRNTIERELKRLGYHEIGHEAMAHAAGYDHADNFFAAIGRGEFKNAQILNTIKSLVAPAAPKPELGKLVTHKRKATGTGAIKIQGIGNLLTQMGQCCKPVYGDQIIGYITKGRGVTVHRSDCSNALKYINDQNERLIEVSWGIEKGETYPVDIQIQAYDRHGLLKDVTSLFADEKLNVVSVNTSLDKNKNIANMLITVEIEDISSLSRVLVKLEQLPNVLEASRRR